MADTSVGVKFENSHVVSRQPVAASPASQRFAYAVLRASAVVRQVSDLSEPRPHIGKAFALRPSATGWVIRNHSTDSTPQL